MHGTFIGASKGIGYMTLVRYLEANPSNSATLLLRKPDLAKKDPKLAPHIASGRINIVQGNATDVQSISAALEGKVDFVMSSVGAAPEFGWSGIKIDQPQVCTHTALALIEALDKKQQRGDKVPRVIAVSSMGIADNHDKMPTAMKIMYSWLLAKPHLDKLGLEYILDRASSSRPTPTDALFYPPESFMPKSQLDSVRADFIPEIIIIRPAFFVSDKEVQPKDKMTVGEDASVYTTTRNMVAKFVADECLPGSGEDGWVGKKPVVGK